MDKDVYFDIDRHEELVMGRWRWMMRWDPTNSSCPYCDASSTPDRLKMSTIGSHFGQIRANSAPKVSFLSDPGALYQP
jgi:hypothetical protein